MRSFLSCLLGSEEDENGSLRVVIFLSCLLGSEVIKRKLYAVPEFLSCLLGSEDRVPKRCRF